MVIDLSEPGQLVRLDPDGTLTPLLGDVKLSNGLDWSPDGETFYFTDTPTLGIDAFDYDLDAGTIANRRRVVTIPRGEGAPDGMCVDDEGCLWTATIFSGRIRRYSPDGELLGVIDTPAHQVSSCTFVRDELFITTIGEEIPRFLPQDLGLAEDLIDAATANPDNGLLLSCRPGVTGAARDAVRLTPQTAPRGSSTISLRSVPMRGIVISTTSPLLEEDRRVLLQPDARRRAGEDDVARMQRQHRADLGDQPVDADEHLARARALALLAVDRRDDLQVAGIARLVGVTIAGPNGRNAS